MGAHTPRWFIGLMSGTSLDGVDGVLVDLYGQKCHVAQAASASLAPELKAELLALNRPGGEQELHRAALAANGLARACGSLVGQARDQGLLINVTAERVVRLLPPLIFSEDEARQLIEILVPLIKKLLDQ